MLLLGLLGFLAQNFFLVVELDIVVRQVTLCINIVNGVPKDLEVKADSVEQVVSDELDEALLVAHEELMAGFRQHMKLASPYLPKAICPDYLTGAPRIHPIVFTVYEGNRERDIRIA